MAVGSYDLICAGVVERETPAEVGEDAAAAADKCPVAGDVESAFGVVHQLNPKTTRSDPIAMGLGRERYIGA